MRFVLRLLFMTALSTKGLSPVPPEPESVVEACKRIVIERYVCTDCALPEVIGDIKELGRRYDAKKTGVFVMFIHPMHLEAGISKGKPPRVTLDIRDRTMYDILMAIGRQVGLYPRFDTHAVMLQPSVHWGFPEKEVCDVVRSAKDLRVWMLARDGDYDRRPPANAVRMDATYRGQLVTAMSNPENHQMVDHICGFYPTIGISASSSGKTVTILIALSCGDWEIWLEDKKVLYAEAGGQETLELAKTALYALGVWKRAPNEE